jgi:hypothetical protein
VLHNFYFLSEKMRAIGRKERARRINHPQTPQGEKIRLAKLIFQNLFVF